MSELNQLQENLYNLLGEIDDICRKHDVQYFLAGGTALGTVRNHCFLPWDDDVDLYITRDNWNKLKHVLETEENVLPEGRSLIYNDNTQYYRNPIARYVDNTTTAIYKSQALPGKACGQHIEFLIMDPMPNDPEERQDYIDHLRVYTELLSPYFVVCKNLSLEDWKRHYELYEKYLKRVDSEGEEKVFKELRDRLQHYPTEDCRTFCMRWGVDILLYEKEYYGNGRLELFEDREFPVAEFAEKIFRVAYGDSWMYIPEPENQVIHNSLQDIETPFSEYTKRYLPKINRETVFKKYQKNKRSNAKVFYDRRKLDSLVAKEKVIVESEYISKDLDNKEDYLRSLLENKDYDELSKEFESYNKLQFIKSVRKYGIVVPISDKNLATLLFSMIDRGTYYNANKYLNIRKLKEEPLSDELETIEEIINLCRQLSIARYDFKDESQVQSLLDEYEGKYPDLLDIHRSKIWIMEMHAESADDFAKIDEYCQRVLDEYPFDGETMAIQARAKMECGNKSEAMELYEKAIHNTRNGLIWQKVQDECGINRIEDEREVERVVTIDNLKQEKQLELLQEINEICEENGLKYIMIGRSSLNAFWNNTIKNGSRMVAIAMTQGDIDRFCKVVEEKYGETRYVEGIFNNPRYVPFYVSYGNRNTADFNMILQNTNRHHGIRIRIYPIIKSRDLEDNPIVGWTPMLSKERKLRLYLNRVVKNKKLWYLRFGLWLGNGLYSLTGGSKRYYNKIKHNTFIDKWEDIQNYSEVRISRKVYETDILRNVKRVDVDNTYTYLPDPCEDYFLYVLGENYEEIEIKPKKQRMRILVDTQKGYDQIYEETGDLLSELRAVHEGVMVERFKCRNEKDTVANVWRLVKMAGKELELMEFSEENIDRLLEYNRDDEEELQELYKELSPVISPLRRYSKYGMTFSVDPKMDALVEDVLIRTEREALLEKLKEISKRQYFIE